MSKQFWLMKLEPHVFSFEDLKSAPNSTTYWDGVRNYQTRNFMCNQMKIDDLLLYCHSNCDISGVANIAELVCEGYPDFSAWDSASYYFDPKSTLDNPRWFMVDIKWKQALPRVVCLKEMKESPELSGMKVVQRGMRLSGQPGEEIYFGRVVETA